MSSPNKEKSVNEQESYQPVYDYHFYVRLHLCWILAVVAIFLGPAWWLVPLPGDSLLPLYRTYPSTILKAFFEGLAVILAARSLVVALIKVFTKGIYPDSVIKFRATGGIEAVFSGIRYRSGVRYFLIASLLPMAGLLGNLLQAEFQSSDAVFYHLEGSVSNMGTAQCQHTTPNQYSLASTAFSNGLITHTLSDASSIINNFNHSVTPNFGVSLIATRFTPISNISVQALNTLTKRDDLLSGSNNQNEATLSNGLDLSEQQISNHIVSAVVQQTNITTVLVDGEPITDLQDQIHHIQTLSQITVNTTSTNEAIMLYLFRYTSSSNGSEAIVVVSNPPEYYKAGFYVSSQSTRYSCFAGTTRQCSENSASTSNADKTVANVLVEAMRNNVGLYGTLITDVLSGNLKNNSLADALFANPLCTELDIYSSPGKPLYPYTRASWSILAILWAALLIVIWVIGAYLIGYTIDVFFRLSQSGNLLSQIISTSTIFVDAEQGVPMSEKMFLNWQQVELLTDKDQPLYIGNSSSHGYTVTTEEL